MAGGDAEGEEDNWEKPTSRENDSDSGRGQAETTITYTKEQVEVVQRSICKQCTHTFCSTVNPELFVVNIFS